MTASSSRSRAPPPQIETRLRPGPRAVPRAYGPGGAGARRPAPLVPSALAGDLDGITGLDDLSRPVPELARPGDRPQLAATTPDAQSGPAPRRRWPDAPPRAAPTAIHATGGLSADQLASAYSFSGLYPGTEGSGVTVGIYELEPYLDERHRDLRGLATPRPSPRRSTGSSVDGADPNAGPGSGEAALDIEMVVGMAPKADRRSLRRVPTAGAGRSTPTRAWSTTTPPEVIHDQLGPVRGAAGAGRTSRPSRRCSSRRWPRDRPSSPPRATRAPRTATSSPSSTDTRPAGRRSRQPALGDERGGDRRSTPWGPRRARPCGTRVSTAARAEEGSPRCGPCRHGSGPGVQSVYTRPGDNFTGAQPCPTELGRGNAVVPGGARRGLRRGPVPGLVIACSCAAAGGPGSVARAWPHRCGVRSPRWPTRGRARPSGFLNPALYQAQCAGQPRLQRHHDGEQRTRPARLRAIRPDPRSGPVLPGHARLRPGHRARHACGGRPRRRPAGPAAEQLPRGDRDLDLVGPRRGGDAR